MYAGVIGCLAKCSLSGRCSTKPPLGFPANFTSLILSISSFLIPTPVVKAHTGCPFS